MNKKKKTVSANYLDYVPSIKEGTKFSINEKKEVTIFATNTGVFNWLAQKIFHKPRVSQIHLDEMGNFIWPLIDGTRSVNDIAELVKEQFGEKAEPLYNRLVQYMRNLESYGWIECKEI